jgi:hypothetical protein
MSKNFSVIKVQIQFAILWNTLCYRYRKRRREFFLIHYLSQVLQLKKKNSFISWEKEHKNYHIQLTLNKFYNMSDEAN